MAIANAEAANPTRRCSKPTTFATILLLSLLLYRTKELKAPPGIRLQDETRYKTEETTSRTTKLQNSTHLEPEDATREQAADIGHATEGNQPRTELLKVKAQPDTSYQIHKNGCHRNCPAHDRHQNIVILDHFGAAGLNDRIRIISNFAKLAAYMCARVHIPPPHSMLRSEHNGGMLVHRNLTWDDLIDVRYVYDNASALVQYQMDWDPTRGIRTKFNLSGMLAEPKYANWTRVTMKGRNMILEQLDTLDKYYAKEQNRQSSTGFIWEIYDRYSYKSVTGKWKERTGNCISQKMSAPLSRLLTDRVFDYLSQRYPSTDLFVPLHIRRGDATRSCDTSLKRMHQRLSCSLEQPSASPGNVTILLGTDELDPCYRNAIKVMVESMGHSFADLDATVLEVVQNYSKGTYDGGRLLNNMFVYSVGLNFMWDPRIKFRLDWRRRVTCPDCIPMPTLTEQEHHLTKNHAALSPSIKSDFGAAEEAYSQCRLHPEPENATGEVKVVIGYVANGRRRRGSGRRKISNDQFE
ncbi:hypothetical protein ACHAWF_006382 [Thalassiosira exigua]